MAELKTFLRGAVEEKRIDKEAILADMDALADEAGDWKDHLPYGAAVDFHSDEGVRKLYAGHVDKCRYCQEMLDTLHPSDHLLGVLHSAVAEEAAWDEDRAGHSSGGNWSPGFAVAAFVLMAAVFGLGVFGNSLIDQLHVKNANIFGEHERQRGSTPNGHQAGFVSQGAEKLFELADLRLFDQSPRPEDRFLAARAYLIADQTALAYQRVGEGLAFAGVDSEFAAAISNAPMLTNGELAEIIAAYEELDEIKLKGTIDNDDIFQRVQLNAKVGRHADAMASISEYLRHLETNPEIRVLFDDLLILDSAVKELQIEEAASNR